MSKQWKTQRWLDDLVMVGHNVMKNKHWKGDTLNSSGSKVVQIRNDKEIFAIKSNDTEVVLNRQEAQFLLISLQRALEDK